MSVVGFDFGSESCIISVCRRGGLDVLQNEVGNRKTATMVAFAQNQRLLGDSAKGQAGSNWKNTVRNFKGLLQVNRMDHPDIKREQKHFAYKIVDRGEGALGIEVKYDWKKEVFSPQQITGMMLQQLKATAEKGLNQRVVDCVLSVPPLWTQEARCALLDSANIAGLNVLRLMNETTAVALTYGILRQLPPNPTNVLFVDMGFSHTNACIAEFKTGNLKILGVDTDDNLGGRDFDTIVFDYFADMIEKKYKLKVNTNKKACLKLMKACQKVKLTLSANVNVPFGVEYLMNDTDVKGKITRSEYEEAAAPMLTRIAPLLDSALAKSGLAKSDISAVEIVGGGVRTPCVQKAIQAWYGGVLSKTCDGDESVARGCALQCAMLSPVVKVRDFNVVDTQPYAVNLEWGSMTAENDMDALESLDAPLFAVGDSLPCVKNVSFSDRRGPFQVVASYTEPGSLPSGVAPHIGRYVIKGFPTELIDEHPKIKVEFNLDVHGLFTTVKATLVQIKPEEPEAATDAPAAEGDAMDTTEEGKPDDSKKAAPAEKPKKKKLRTPLQIDRFTLGMDQKTRQLCYEKECSMNNQDRVIVETAVARDMLERYVLEMRSKVEDREDLANYCTSAEKDHFFSLLTTEDDWLMSDEGYEGNKSQYKSKLAGLMKFGSPFVNRQFEHRERKGSVDTLRKMVHHYQQFAQTTDEKYAHISVEDRGKITAKCTEVDQWIAVELSRQDRLALNVDPVLTKKMLIAKAKELDAVCKPIKNTPKPAPPKEEKTEEKKEEEKTAEAPVEPEEKTEPMETNE